MAVVSSSDGDDVQIAIGHHHVTSIYLIQLLNHVKLTFKKLIKLNLVKTSGGSDGENVVAIVLNPRRHLDVLPHRFRRNEASEDGSSTHTNAHRLSRNVQYRW